MLGKMLIRQNGNVLEIGDMDGPGISAHALTALEPLMTYTYKQSLHGPDVYVDTAGRVHKMRFERRALYKIVDGRLRTGHGMLRASTHSLQSAGYTVLYQDVTPPHPRPDRYAVDWSRLAGIAFRPRQEECLHAILKSRCGKIDAPPGLGKTEIIVMLALLLYQARIHIVVRSRDIARSVQRRLLRYLPNIGFIGDGSLLEGRITVVMADSLHHVKAGADILMIDEAHQMMAQSYATELSNRYTNCRCYAFSATFDCRPDGQDAEMRYLFGDTIFYMDYPEAIALGLVLPVHIDWMRVDSDVDPAGGKSGVSAKRWGLWRNDFRNKLIAGHVNGWSPNTQILILVETVEHAAYLRRCLPKFEICCGTSEGHKDWPADLPQMTQQRRAEMLEAFTNQQLLHVIATDVWSTGVDFQRLSVLYRADARQSRILNMQGPGRTSRIFEGKEYGTVVDTADGFNPTFHNTAKQRRKDYASFGWRQNWPKSLHDRGAP